MQNLMTDGESGLRLKKRIIRLRYYFSWKYPKLCSYWRKGAFPIQLAALCLGLYGAVNFYTDNFSYAAAMKTPLPQLPVSAQRERSNRLLYASPNQNLDTAQPVPMATPVSAPVAATQKPAKNPEKAHQMLRYQALRAEASVGQMPPQHTANNTIAAISNVPLSAPEPTATSAEKMVLNQKALTAEVRRAEEILQEKKRQAQVLEIKIQNARALLNTSKLVPEKAPIYTHRWLGAQNPSRYVIQLASSTNYKELLDFVSDKQLQQPIAIYPFKKSRAGTVVYGVSAGLYSTSSEAMKSASSLSNTKAHGVWIRKVADLRDLMTELR